MRKECAPNLLQTTALVHEAYMRLIDDPKFNVDSRGHFFALASVQMRRVLVDCARAARAARRGAGAHHESLDVVQIAVESEGVDILMLDFALTELEQLDPRAAKTVELKFFAGLTDKEAAEALGVSPATIRREWDYARTWLTSQIRGGNAAAG
jgi:RNA polymerase sigma factor (TIGR02999 family)